MMSLILVLASGEDLEINVRDQLLLSAWDLIHDTPKS